jgi:hypothetical protein
LIALLIYHKERSNSILSEFIQIAVHLTADDYSSFLKGQLSNAHGKGETGSIKNGIVTCENLFCQLRRKRQLADMKFGKMETYLLLVIRCKVTISGYAYSQPGYGT